MQRIVGVDLLRGLAVLGMFAAHVGNDVPPFWSPSGWLVVADGRSAATFALLAGVSAALLSGGAQPLEGPRLRHAVVRILARAVALWPLGTVMIALGTPVAVILPTYAVMFALVAVALRWRLGTLLGVAATIAVIGPVVWLAVRGASSAVGIPRLPQALDVLFGTHYPAVVWMAYLLVGVTIGRADLTSPRTLGRLALLGAGLAVAGYGVGALATEALAPQHTVQRLLLSIAPHANTTTEVVGNIGVSLLLLAGCVVLARRAAPLVAPLAATGALALTAYCGHLVAIATLGDRVVRMPSNGVLVTFVLVTLAVTWAWRTLAGRGPLERLLHSWSTTVADAVVPGGRRPAAQTGAAAPGPGHPGYPGHGHPAHDHLPAGPTGT